MKTNWQTKKLSEVFIIRPPKHEAKEKLTREDLVSFVPMEDLNVDKKEFVSIQFKPLGKVFGGYTYFANNDVLLAKITPCFENGKLGIARNLKNGVGFGSSEFVVFKSNGEVVSDYLYYLLLTDSFRNEGSKIMTGASGHKRVPKDYIENYLISFPISLSEQKRIVKILDEVFENIGKTKENAEKNLQNSNELFESYLNDIFANEKWKFVSIAEKCQTGAGGTPLKSHKEYYEGGNIPWIRSGEVNKKEITKSKMFITKIGMDNSSARLFPPNTVLVAMYGATAGQVGILKFESTTNQAVCGILPSEYFLPEFIYYVLLSKKRELVLQAVGGAQPNISQIKVRNTSLPDININKQKEIVKKLDELSKQTKKLQENYKQKLLLLDELKKSVLAKAFAGEL